MTPSPQDVRRVVENLIREVDRFMPIFKAHRQAEVNLIGSTADVLSLILEDLEDVEVLSRDELEERAKSARRHLGTLYGRLLHVKEKLSEQCEQLGSL